MKSIIWGVLVILIVAANGSCDEISATITKTSHHTVITCSPQGDEEVEKAYLTLYTSEEQPLSFSWQKMKVSYENTASYVLQGSHDVILGKCKLILAGNKEILGEEFIARDNSFYQ